jgi:preprotein translocase subunit SecE
MFARFGTFLKETKQELNKVTWPSRPELMGSTVIVIAMTLLLAVFIGFVDSILTAVVRILIR